MNGTTSDGPPGVRRVLLVEDSLEEAFLLRTLLEWDGRYRVTVAQDGLLGRSLAAEERWDLVITDLNLPGTSGLEVIRASKEANPAAPILTTTGYTAGPHLAAAVTAGADLVLQKPIVRDGLLQAVESLILRARAAGAPATVLALGAHPGDVEWGCGGVLASHADRGHDVWILVVHGDGPAWDPDRRTPADEAASRLGASVLKADLVLADAALEAGDVAGLIAGAVQKLAPGVVYTHSPHESGPSRLEVSRATVQAASGVARVVGYRSDTSTPEFRPDVRVKVARFADRKREALALHRGRRGAARPGEPGGSGEADGGSPGSVDVEGLEHLADVGSQPRDRAAPALAASSP